MQRSGNIRLDTQQDVIIVSMEQLNATNLVEWTPNIEMEKRQYLVSTNVSNQTNEHPQERVAHYY